MPSLHTERYNRIMGTAVVMSPAAAQTFSSRELDGQSLEQRAVSVAIWACPSAANGMRQAFFRDAKANYGDVVFWSKPSDWKNRTTTPSASALCVFNFNTKDGPLVVDIPPAVEAGFLWGCGRRNLSDPRPRVGLRIS